MPFFGWEQMLLSLVPVVCLDIVKVVFKQSPSRNKAGALVLQLNSVF